MKKNMKTRILTAALAAVMAVSTVTSVMAAENKGADQLSSQNEAAYNASSMAASEQSSAADKYINNVCRLRKLKYQKVQVTLRQSGPYVVKNWKFYGRKAIGVAENGDFIFGKWEILDDRDNITCLSDYTHMEITADYMQLAFSCDVVWGTDFPYSGVFWNEPDLTLQKVEVSMMGGCRTVSVHFDIKAGNESNRTCCDRSIREDNCSSHKEWKP